MLRITPDPLRLVYGYLRDLRAALEAGDGRRMGETLEALVDHLMTTICDSDWHGAQAAAGAAASRKAGLLRLLPVIVHEAVGAMRAFPTSEGVQEHGCGLMDVIVGTIEQRPEIAEEVGGVPALLVAAVRTFPDNGSLANNMANALLTLVKSRWCRRTRSMLQEPAERAAREAVAAGAVEAMAASLPGALRSGETEAANVLFSLANVLLMSDDDDAAEAAVRAAFSFVRTHPGGGAFQEVDSAAYNLFDMNDCDSLRAAAVEAGAAEVLVRTLRCELSGTDTGRPAVLARFEAEEVASWLGLLAALAEEVEEAAPALIAAGAHAVVIEALRSERVVGRHAPCVAAACRALRALMAATPELQARAEATEAAEAVARAAQAHPQDAEVQSAIAVWQDFFPAQAA